MFRWCTDKLRIEPVDRVMREIAAGEKCVLVLGARFGESMSRDRTLGENRAVSELGDGYFRSANRYA